MKLPRVPRASKRILRELCYFHFLNNTQMVLLGLSKSEDSLGVHALPPLAPARNKAGEEIIPRGKSAAGYLCSTYRYANSDPSEPGTKQRYVYYLTPAGLDYARQCYADELEDLDVWVPPDRDELSNEFFHRRDYVTAHIHLRKWARAKEAEIEFFTHDYQGDPAHRGRGRPSSINLVACDDRRWKHAKPDGLLGLTHRGKPRLFVLELHRRTPTKKVVEQLYRNFKATEAINNRFADYPTQNDPFILSVFSKTEDMRPVMNLIRETPAFGSVLEGIFFTSLARLSHDFSTAWAYADNRPVTIFR